MIDQFDCRICGAKQLQELPSYPRLPRVTSDCKPFPSGGRLALCTACGAVQKPNDSRWQLEIEAIYRDYDIYFQSAGGVEQAVFDPSQGMPRLRSRLILERVSSIRNPPPRGALLDVGCGKGAFLSAFADFRPDWELFGHELSAQATDSLVRIPAFKQLYSGPISSLPRAFDLVTLIHSLEHFAHPHEGMRDLRDRIGDGGCLLVEVPNAAATPFDLVVADHASHFSKTDLSRLLRRSGFTPIVVTDAWITKELSAIAEPSALGAAHGRVELAAPASAHIVDRVDAQIDWLTSVVSSARLGARGRPGKFGLFGTSIAAMWLLGELGDQVAFFVDEDPSRLHSLHGRPVFSPHQVPDGAVVYLALIPEVARAVAGRLARPGVEFQCPPELAQG